MDLLFVILVVLGFLFKALASFNINHMERAAWITWLIAAILWAAPKLG